MQGISERENTLMTMAAGTELVNRIGNKMRQKIKGQENAIQQVEAALFHAFVLQKENPNGPKMAMTFVGLPAVGKTELAKIIAEELGLNFVFVPLSSYADKESHQHAAGFDRTFKDSKAGAWTKAALEDPNTIFCFDELGTEHKVTTNLLLQILNDGKLHDAYYEKDVSFENAILIFTTNLGASIYKNVNQWNYAATSKSRIEEALREEKDGVSGESKLSGAIISRLAKYPMIAFNKLDGRVLSEIATEYKEEMVDRLKEKYPNLSIECNGKELAQVLLFHKGGRADARSMVAETETFIASTIHNVMGKLQDRGTDVLSLRKITFAFNLQDLPAEIKDLREKPDHRKVGVFCSADNQAIFQQCALLQVEEIKKERFNSLDYDCIVIEITKENAAQAKRIFDAAIQEQDIPVYVFSQEKEFDRIDAKEYFIKGAVDVLYGERNLTDWIDTISTTLTLCNISSFLNRANKILKFDVGYRFQEIEDGLEAHVILQNHQLAMNVDSKAENEILLGSEIPDTKFSDVKGLEEAVLEAKRSVEFLKDYKGNIRKGKKAPKGILLEGAPGCGKTLLARAIAAEAQMPFIYISASELSSPHYGIAEKMVRDKFDVARQHAPSILFIDEVDSIARPRGRSMDMGQEETVLNMLLCEMDGLKQDKKRPVFVIAATNFSELDSAFLRRFDRHIEVKLPNAKGRSEVLNYYLVKHSICLAEDAFHSLVERTQGKSPADIEKLVEYVVRNTDGVQITAKELDIALELLEFGRQQEREKETVKQTSYHEAGHAVIAWALGNTPTYVTNVARGNHGGYVLPSGEEDKLSHSKQELLDKICTAFGGRAAERMVYGEKGITSGASADISQARKLARIAIVNYAMYDDLLLGLGEEQSEATKRLIDEKINALLSEQYQRAWRIAQEQEQVIKALVAALMEKHSMTKAELDSLFSNFDKKNGRITEYENNT